MEVDNENIPSDITNASISACKRAEEDVDETDATCNDTIQNSAQKSFYITHKNLSRKKCLLAEDIPDIRSNILELTVFPDDLSDSGAYDKNTPVDPEKNCIVERCEHQQNATDLCRNNDYVTSDDTVPPSSLTNKISSRDDNSTPTNHNSLVNVLLKTSDDNNKSNSMCQDVNSSDESAILPSRASRESPASRSALSNSCHSDVIDNDAKTFSNSLDNNRNSFENVIGGSVLLAPSENSCKHTLTPQDAGCTLSQHYDDSASTSKPFKLPILEKMPKTANVQQPVEVEENAVALLDPSFTRRDQLEEVRCLDLEPRSSNSSEESNSDVESQHPSTSHNDVKKVSKLMYDFYVTLHKLTILYKLRILVNVKFIKRQKMCEFYINQQ